MISRTAVVDALKPVGPLVDAAFAHARTREEQFIDQFGADLRPFVYGNATGTNFWAFAASALEVPMDEVLARLVGQQIRWRAESEDGPFVVRMKSEAEDIKHEQQLALEDPAMFSTVPMPVVALTWDEGYPHFTAVHNGAALWQAIFMDELLDPPAGPKIVPEVQPRRVVKPRQGDDEIGGTGS